MVFKRNIGIGSRKNAILLIALHTLARITKVHLFAVEECLSSSSSSSPP